MILNIILAICIIIFAVFEVIYILREYKQSHEKKDLIKIILQIIVLSIALGLLIFSAIIFNQKE
ncbi:MAG: hypothetical protein ABH873_02770 [Candidatus Firestonebacteria bacterium]